MNFEWSNEIFAENLRWYKDEANMNQKEIAAVAGVSSPTVSEWLCAKKMPRMDKVEKLANHFGIQKSDLLERRINKEDIKEANAVARISRFAQMNDKYLEVALLLTELSEAELDSVGNLVLMLTQKSENKK